MDLDRFTVERYVLQCYRNFNTGKYLTPTRVWMRSYRQIVINKTAYYTFYLSAACAMFLNGVVDEPSHNLAKKICVQIGEYFRSRMISSTAMATRM